LRRALAATISARALKLSIMHRETRLMKSGKNRQIILKCDALSLRENLSIFGGLNFTSQAARKNAMMLAATPVSVTSN
jgi:hypothetical protein